MESNFKVTITVLDNKLLIPVDTRVYIRFLSKMFYTTISYNNAQESIFCTHEMNALRIISYI